MSELGIVGTEYVNRRTGKTGFFVSQDDEKKVVKLAEGNELFTVPFATFKSAWRVLTINELGNDEAVAEPEEVVNNEVVNEIVDEPKIDTSNFTDEEKINEAKAYIKSHRDANIIGTDAMLQIYVDDILVFNAVASEDGYHICMLPDVYTYSALTENDFSNVKIQSGKSDYLAVALVCKKPMGDILQMIKESVTEINLYGYKN